MNTSTRRDEEHREDSTSDSNKQEDDMISNWMTTTQGTTVMTTMGNQQCEPDIVTPAEIEMEEPDIVYVGSPEINDFDGIEGRRDSMESTRM